MPNIKSAKKRLRQNIARRIHNRAVKSELRTLCRRVREAVEAKDLEKAQAEFRLASKKLDRAGSANVIHANAAARLKSRLSARVKSLKQPASA